VRAKIAAFSLIKGVRSALRERNKQCGAVSSRQVRPGRHGVAPIIAGQPSDLLDLWVLPIVALVVSTLALTACWLPARGSIKLDATLILQAD